MAKCWWDSFYLLYFCNIRTKIRFFLFCFYALFFLIFCCFFTIFHLYPQTRRKSTATFLSFRWIFATFFVYYAKDSFTYSPTFLLCIARFLSASSTLCCFFILSNCRRFSTVAIFSSFRASTIDSTVFCRSRTLPDNGYSMNSFWRQNLFQLCFCCT